MKAIHNKFKLLIVTGKAVNYTQRYKKMKAIHNKRLDLSECAAAVNYTQRYKNESNSQPKDAAFLTKQAVNYTQRYKK